MPSRRSHTKSHHGCRQCKARRVKCDEQVPQCDRCLKRQITCSFLEDSIDGYSTPAASSTVTVTDHVTPNLSGYPTPEVAQHRYDPLPPPQQSSAHRSPLTPHGFDLLELELMHHYCTRTYMTISSRLSTHVIFRDAVFREALRHEFLMHGIMATSALHKATTQPKSSAAYEEYAKVALTHQNAALSGYIPAVSNPSQENGIAIFSLSLLLTVWAFASKSLPDGLKSANLASEFTSYDKLLPVDSPTSQFVDIILILRGIYPVIKETDSWLHGEIEEMLRYPRDEDLPPHPIDVEEAFDLLAAAIQNFHPDGYSNDVRATEHRELCLKQVGRLRNISRCRSVVEWDGHIFSFLMMVPPEFITCIKQGHAMALTVFAHWAAIFRCMDHHWWANGWAQTLVSDVLNLLDLQVWSSALEWPRRQVGLVFQDGTIYDSRRAP